MRVLLYSDFNAFSVVDQEVPSPADDEVLLQVSACGICGSELESVKSKSPRRPPPLIFGHEFCGTIVATGREATGWTCGQKVISNSLVSCGQCPPCLRGDDHLCRQRNLFGMHRSGAFAEYVAVPARCLVAWPNSLPAEVACLAEPLGNAVHMVNLTFDLKPATVVVIGAGPIGLLAQQAFQVMTGAKVIVADLSPARLRAAAAVGAARTVEVKSEDLISVTRQLSDGEGADVVIDAVGSEQTKRQSLQIVRTGGAVVWIGLHQDEVRIPSYMVTLSEIRLHGSYGARLTELKAAVDLLATGKIITRSWVKSAPLPTGEALFRRMLAAKADDIKGVLIP